MRRALAVAGVLLTAAVTSVVADSPRPADPAWRALERQAAVIRPAPADVKWQRLPWIVDPNEAIAVAKAEKRPIFFWAAGGRGRDGLPLERC